MSHLGENIPASKHAKKNSTDLRAVASPRRMTAGPLDLNFEPPQPPADGTASISTATSGATYATAQEGLSSPSSTTDSVATISSSAAAAVVAATSEPPRDYAYLLDPLIFRHLPPTERNQLALLPLCTHLYTLSSQCSTRLATTSATDSFHIFNLWYIRLTVLSLISAQTTAMASQEIKIFGDLTSGFYRNSALVHVVPWDLRVLAIRLQALGFDDWRRCLEHFYMLAREARAEAIKHRTSPALFKLWRSRLLDLGLRIAAALVEISDLDGAERHLKALLEERDELDESGGAGTFRLREAVLYVQLGQLDTAKNCYLANGVGEGEDVDAVIEGLRLMAIDDYEGAALLWKGLVDKESGGSENETRTIYLVNMVASLLYLRRLPEAQSTSSFKPQSTLDRQLAYSYKSLAFNIATLHNMLDFQYGSLDARLREHLEALNEEMTGVMRKREQAAQA